MSDLIQFQSAAGFVRAENVGKARINGVEAHASAEIFNHASLAANYTLQWAKDRARYPGRYLTGRPRHEVNGTVEGWTGPFKAFFALNWIDSNFLDPLNTQKVSNRMILNAGASLKIKKSWRVAFEAKNLANQQIVDVVGYPLPGRSFFGRVSYDFDR